MQGGHKSGFSHVEHVLKPRLMSVKGKHTPRIREVNGQCKINITCTSVARISALNWLYSLSLGFSSLWVCQERTNWEKGRFFCRYPKIEV